MGCNGSRNPGDDKGKAQSEQQQQQQQEQPNDKKPSALVTNGHQEPKRSAARFADPPDAATAAAQDGDAKRDEHAHQPKTRESSMFTSLALKFPMIRAAFRHVKRAFYKFTPSSKDHHIPSERLGEVLKALGAHDLSETNIQQLLQEASLSKSKQISFREFLIAIAEGYYLRKDLAAEEENKRNPNFMEVKRGFKIVEEAFHKIDADHGGTVNPTELKAALFTLHDNEAASDILEARFKELDFDGDKDIRFPEFLYGFAAWVGYDDEEEDEEEENEAESEAEKNAHQNGHVDAST